MSCRVSQIYNGIECSFCQVVATLDTVTVVHANNSDANQSSSGESYATAGLADKRASSSLTVASQMHLLGKISKKLVITPDFEASIA